MYLNLSYRSIYDQLDEALSKKTLIVTNRKTRRIGKTEALVHLAKIKELPIVVKDLIVESYAKENPSIRVIGETNATRSTLLNTVLIEEGVQEKTITILREKGVTVSGFFVDMSSYDSPYEERREIEHGIEYTSLVKGLGIPTLMTKEEAENLEPQTLEDPPLLQITLKDIHSVPEVIHNGEPLEGRVDIDFNWKTGGFDTVGSTYINLRTLGNKGKKPIEKRIEYKRGEALHEEVTKTLQ
ncbi:hypothetical protein [Bacillus altitudinis]|uniref:hypothetical protein n=1 Tax=Bacillus altitudinis TaxID=293387 RepID=UPI001F60CD63|nr:hypothetical protein [Bacillus altitudinis]